MSDRITRYYKEAKDFFESDKMSPSGERMFNPLVQIQRGSGQVQASLTDYEAGFMMDVKSRRANFMGQKLAFTVSDTSKTSSFDDLLRLMYFTALAENSGEKVSNRVVKDLSRLIKDSPVLGGYYNSTSAKTGGEVASMIESHGWENLSER